MPAYSLSFENSLIIGPRAGQINSGFSKSFRLVALGTFAATSFLPCGRQFGPSTISILLSH